jgi:cobaltochelatase CobN
VPVDRLKSEWRARGLSKAVQLTVSGCLGPCDLPNVVRLSTDDRDMWFGNLRSLDDFLGLADWAEATAVAGSAAPLSPRMKGARFDPFRRGEIGRGRLDPGPTRAIPRTEDDR